METVAEIISVDQLASGDKVLIVPSQKVPLCMVATRYTDVSSSTLPTSWRLVVGTSSSIDRTTRIEVVSVNIPTTDGCQGLCFRAGEGTFLWFLDEAEYGYITVSAG